MGSRQHISIPPFPAEINREVFGQHLSGFTDGEACFGLYHLRQYRTVGTACKTSYTLGLRADDVEMLRLIQSFWGCGLIMRERPSPTSGRSQIVFSITRTRDLMRVVIPHFVKHPLFAKKKRDFLIWSKGVELCAEVRASLRGRRNRRGHNLTWPVAKIEEFRQLAAELRRVRAYPGESSAPAPAAFLPAPLRNPQGFLFDDMGDD